MEHDEIEEQEQNADAGTEAAVAASSDDIGAAEASPVSQNEGGE